MIDTLIVIALFLKSTHCRIALDIVWGKYEAFSICQTVNIV
jgi:hypothetical protein